MSGRSHSSRKDRHSLVSPQSRPFKRAFAAVLEFSGHLIVILSLLLGFRLVEEVMHRLWGPTEYLFFGKVPMRWVFDAADLALLGVLLIYGIYAVVKVYVRDPD